MTQIIRYGKAEGKTMCQRRYDTNDTNPIEAMLLMFIKPSQLKWVDTVEPERVGA